MKKLLVSLILLFIFGVFVRITHAKNEFKQIVKLRIPQKEIVTPKRMNVIIKSNPTRTFKLNLIRSMEQQVESLNVKIRSLKSELGIINN